VLIALLAVGCAPGAARVPLGGSALADDLREATGHVVAPIGSAAVIDWSALELRVAGGAIGSSQDGHYVVEENARRMVDALFVEVVDDIPVDAETDLGDVMSDAALAESTRSRIARWEVVEATYTTSRRVDLVASLSVQTLLKPWLMTIARPGSPPPRPAAAPAPGVVVDARGIAFEPTYVARLATLDGRVLYGGEMWEEQAVEAPPFAYVTSLDEAVARARVGAADAPVLSLVATAFSGGVLRLDEDSHARALEAADVWGRATVFVVVDGG
jgi:hypothetical protein